MKLIALLTCALSSLSFAASPGKTLAIPDFTKGDTIPAQAKHDWNLGPTGLRGWMFSDKIVTSDARQIAITQVDATSPADGSFVVGDVLLGVGGKPFASDPRTELGKAITLAESAAGQGKLTLTRWRAGKTEEVTLQLATLGNYSATAPFDCKKSQRIFTQGCQALATKMAQANPHQDAIVRSLNALALLASGDPQYLPLLKKEAQWAADYTSDSMQTWHYGYVMIFLAEYIIASEDKSVLPGLRRLALEAAKGQSAVGSWGHGFAIPDGRLGGYGMMNSPGIPLTISLSLAIKAGVKDPEIPRAIELSARLLRFYIGKGAVPYGDHHPWIENHDDNGKCGMAAVLFQLLEEPQAAEFFSRMSVACHGPGALNAPKIGDKAAWGKLIPHGLAALTQAATPKTANAIPVNQPIAMHQSGWSEEVVNPRGSTRAIRSVPAIIGRMRDRASRKPSSRASFDSDRPSFDGMREIDSAPLAWASPMRRSTLALISSLQRLKL